MRKLINNFKGDILSNSFYVIDVILHQKNKYRNSFSLLFRRAFHTQKRQSESLIPLYIHSEIVENFRVEISRREKWPTNGKKTPQTRFVFADFVFGERSGRTVPAFLSSSRNESGCYLGILVRKAFRENFPDAASNYTQYIFRRRCRNFPR